MEYDEAILIISKNFKCLFGVISKRNQNYVPTNEEVEALDFLFLEYDFVYSGELLKESDENIDI